MEKTSMERIIKHSRHPLLTRMYIETAIKLEMMDRLWGHKRITTAANRHSAKKVAARLDLCMDETLHSIAGEDYETFADKALQQSHKAYLNQSMLSPGPSMETDNAAVG